MQKYIKFRMSIYAVNNVEFTNFVVPVKNVMTTSYGPLSCFFIKIASKPVF